MKLDLIRVEESDQGTIGVLVLNNYAFCCTLEPPDYDNIANESCIPSGVYLCQRVISFRYGDTFEVIGVPGRTDILFHAGNVVHHTKGCILLGQYFGKLKGERAVLNSGKTFKTFMKALNGRDSFALNISAPVV